MIKIFEGLLAEIGVAIVTGISIFVFNRYLHPYFLGVIQNVSDISGTWTGFDIDENGQEQLKSRMQIKQLGSSITATITRNSGKDGERLFEYKGTISSGQVLLIWKERKSNGYNMGTMTLLLSSDLCCLRGKSTFHHKDLGKIVSIDRIYRKVNN